MKQLAGAELTKQALSLVEQGKSRPSLRTLLLIAERTGKPLDHFLAGPLPSEPVPVLVEVELAELEHLTAREEFRGVIALGQRLLETDLPPSARARVQLRIGKAYVRLSDPDAALEHLRPARAAFRQLGDPWLEVECMNYEAGVLHLKEQPGAVELAEAALVRCRELDPVPLQTELGLLVNLVNFHAGRHDWTRAIAAGQEAISSADAVHDLARMARLQHNLAIAYRNQGEIGRALACAQKALALHEFERDGAHKARVENTMGLIQLQQGDLQGAERSLRSSLAGYAGTPRESTGKGHVLMSLAELHVARDEPVEAEKALREALAGFEERGERMSVALGYQLLGAAIEGQGRRKEADGAFEHAIALLQELDVPERLVECHAAFAAVLEVRGETKRALKHWKLGLFSQRPELDRGLPGGAAAAKTG